MINYQILTDSISYYELHGFTRIESPWTVTEYVDSITRPKNVIPYQLTHNKKCLVASGEQSFLYLYLKNYLSLGRYQTLTPCFRYEDYDLTHSKTFMKNELIITDTVNTATLTDIVETALKFFQHYIPTATIKITLDGYDIVYDNYELGSYGIRECEFLKWVYGTGVAEPRLSSLIKIYQNGLSQKRN